jgi:hypothetical protein
MSDVAVQESAPAAVPATKPAAPAYDLKSTINRAEKGDVGCLPEIRAFLAGGELARLYREANGSSAEWLLKSLIEKAAGKNLLIREAIRQKLDSVRAELEGPNPTAIERSLAERASICWFSLHRYTNAYVNAEGSNISQADFQHRKIDKAHARSLSALRTLAQARKLALPALQLNINKNQVNVAESRP